MEDTLSLACIWECWLVANCIALLCTAHYTYESDIAGRRRVAGVALRFGFLFF